MASTLSPSEQAQLEQTIEMFEVITQSQPQDTQSLEILKEAYIKLDRPDDVLKTSKRIAEAYVQLGQLSSAILEYETILQSHPEDPDIQAALQAIEGRATNITATEAAAPKTSPSKARQDKETKASVQSSSKPLDDGRADMRKIFVDTKIISAGDFDLCWQSPSTGEPPADMVDPFVQVLADKGLLPLDKGLAALSEKARLAFIPIDRYDVDAEVARTVSAELCQRWCVLPFDRMSKSVLVATTNPYNKQVASELAASINGRIVWCLASPAEIGKLIKKVFRLS